MPATSNYDTVQRKHTITIALLDQAAERLERFANDQNLDQYQREVANEALTAVFVARKELGP